MNLWASIFEQFCNEHRLYIATQKTFVTVFHHTDDEGVQYVGDNVTVDGEIVNIQIYGTVIGAAQVFKYLGVYLNEYGSMETHIDKRLEAYSRAAAILMKGLRRLPGHTHSMVRYLWMSLVMPVLSYGTEVSTWSTDQQSKAHKTQLCFLR